MRESTVSFVLTLMNDLGPFLNGLLTFASDSSAPSHPGCPSSSTDFGVNFRPTLRFSFRAKPRIIKWCILVTQASFVPFRHEKALSSLLGNDKLPVITLH